MSLALRRLEAAIRADVVPTGDAGLDDFGAAWAKAEAALLYPTSDLGVRRYPDGTGYAWSSGYLGEPNAYIEVHYPGEHGDTPASALLALAARLSSSDTEPSESDPIETFSHPFRAPVVIDGHEYRHTSDCEWPSSSDTGRDRA